MGAPARPGLARAQGERGRLDMREIAQAYGEIALYLGDPDLPNLEGIMAEIQELYPVAGSIEQLLSAGKPTEKTIPIPDLGFSVVARQLSMGQAETMFGDARDQDDTGASQINLQRLNRLLLERCIIRPKLTEDAVNELWASSFKALAPLLQELLEFNGIDRMLGGGAGASRRAFPVDGSQETEI
jgi:hypothetical protein